MALLAAGADAKVEAGKYTPLHAAAWRGHHQVAAVLLAAGADVGAKDSDGHTPLHKAAWNGHLSTVTALLAAGADPKAEVDRYTPLHAAAGRGTTRSWPRFWPKALT